MKDSIKNTNKQLLCSCFCIRFPFPSTLQPNLLRSSWNKPKYNLPV